MKMWERTSNRAVLVALLMAGWCAGWWWLLLGTTRSLPGVVTGDQGGGSVELLEMVSGRPYTVVLWFVFLLALLPPLLLALLRDVCDPKSRARDALCWPLRAKPFLWPAILWMGVGIAFALSVHDIEDAALPFMVIAMVGSFVGPFAGLNPSTLDAEGPHQWWRLSWPGQKAFWQCVLLWLCYAITSFLIAVLATDVKILARVGLAVLDLLLSASVVVLAAALWLNRGQVSMTRADLGRLWRNGFTREFAWQSSAFGLLVAALLVPMAICMLQAIFVIPQYEESARPLGGAIPQALALQAQVFRGRDLLVAVVSVPAGVFGWLALGRLLRLHGTGKGAL